MALMHALAAVCAFVCAACIEVPPPIALLDGVAVDDTIPPSDGDTFAVDPDAAPLAELSCGEAHCCARAEDGRVACWGDRSRAALGDGVHDGARAASLVPLGVSALALGARNACAIDGDTLVCWGDNAGMQSAPSGVLTIDTPTAYVLASDDLADPVPLVALAPGRGRGLCGVDQRDRLICWGVRIGLGATPLADNPGLMQRGRARVELASLPIHAACLGESHVCALATGVTLCWGYGADGQLGHGDGESYATPKVVLGLADLEVEALACGTHHTCVRGHLRDGEGERVRCFGRNTEGQVGAPPSAAVLAPHDIHLPAPVSALTLGAAHACALAGAPPELWCWGADSAGQLGPDAPGARSSPAVVRLPFSPRLATAGFDMSCASDGRSVLCWGSDAWGQLGSGTYGLASVPSLQRVALPF